MAAVYGGFREEVLANFGPAHRAPRNTVSGISAMRYKFQQSDVVGVLMLQHAGWWRAPVHLFGCCTYRMLLSLGPRVHWSACTTRKAAYCSKRLRHRIIMVGVRAASSDASPASSAPPSMPQVEDRSRPDFSIAPMCASTSSCRSTGSWLLKVLGEWCPKATDLNPVCACQHLMPALSTCEVVSSPHRPVAYPQATARGQRMAAAGAVANWLSRIAGWIGLMFTSGSSRASSPSAHGYGPRWWLTRPSSTVTT